MPMVAPKDILSEPWLILKYATKLTSVRLRFMAGDRNLLPKDLSRLHTQKQFDRIYIQNPLFLYMLRRVETRKARAAVKSGKAKSFKLPDLENRQYMKNQNTSG